MGFSYFGPASLCWVATLYCNFICFSHRRSFPEGVDKGVATGPMNCN